jgi:hypothetical protein
VVAPPAARNPRRAPDRNATPEIEAEARRLGADAFLQKPLPLPQLEAIVDGLVEKES